MSSPSLDQSAVPTLIAKTPKRYPPLHHRKVVRWGLDRAVADGKLPSLRRHDLRHLAASALIAEGASVGYLSRLLGHSSPAITLQVYTHEFARAEHDDRTREMMEAMYVEVFGHAELLMHALVALGFHAWLDRWAPLADWAVAIGTIALAVSTAFLGWQARKEAKEVRSQAEAVSTEADAVKRQADAVAQQVEIGREQLSAALRQQEAAQRPLVSPITSGWRPESYFPVEPEFPRGLGSPAEPWIMLANTGSGPAVTVSGAVYYRGGIGGGWQIVPTSLAAGQELPVLLEEHLGHEPRWAETAGYLRYTDLAGTEWLTHFRYRQNASGQWWVDVRASGKVAQLGEPDYSLEDGWRNPPADPPSDIYVEGAMGRSTPERR